MMIKRVRGTKDVFGGDILKWQEIEDNIRNVCQVFGYDEIRTPTFEYTELFNRSVGEKTDIVQKEMYTFLDKGGRSISLKPEGTAGAARAYLENKLYAQGLPLKLYYITPAFRYEKPASGRLREFHQFGVELYGIKGIDSEVEVISLCHDFFTRIGSLNVDLEINNIGSFETRQVYISHLKEYISHNLDMFCDDCKHRYNINPLRIFDCKIETCQSLMKKAPVVLNYLDDKSRSDFDSLKATLTAMNIEYKVNDRLVRGLDYYTDVVFEFVLNDYALGSQSTVCGGGRYNCLIGELGGDNISCVGFSVGIERLITALDIYNKSFKKAKSPLIYIGHMGG